MAAEVATDQLDRLIERRASKEPDPDDASREPSYAASVAAYHARRHQAELWERLRFHERQLEAHRVNFREIVRRHKAALAECETQLGIGEEAAMR